MSDQSLHDVAVPADSDSDSAPSPHAPAPTSPLQRLADLAHSPLLPGLSVIAIAVLASNPVNDFLSLCYGGGRHGGG